MSSNMQQIMWVAHPAIESVLAAIMIKRKLNKQFPVFFTYVLWQIANFLILFPLCKMGPAYYDAYFYVSWLSAAVSLGLGFKVIHEIVLNVFQPYHALKDLSTILFRWAALVMLLVALVVAASNAGSNISPITQAVVTAQRCVRVVQCGLILFLLVFSKYLGISWRQHSLGIALGFGGYATIELGAFALFAGGQVQARTVGATQAVCYSLAILVWIGYAVLKAPEREDATKLLTSQRWEQSLTDIQSPAGAPDSLIPMFESMVERAFSRAPNGSDDVVEKQILTLERVEDRVEKFGTPVRKE
jgi:hypothetical protein